MANSHAVSSDIPEIFARLPLTPFCSRWGISQGTPIDRYYIDKFLREHSSRIAGRVLEIKSDSYARLYGESTRVGRVDVLDIDPTNPAATLHCDLARSDQIATATYDCFILTQTLNIIYDVPSALTHAVRILKPGGTLLVTVSAVNRISAEDGGLDEDYWRFTLGSIRTMVAATPRATLLDLRGFGNVFACAAFLYGLAAEQVTATQLDYCDPYFPVVYGFTIVAC